MSVGKRQLWVDTAPLINLNDGCDDDIRVLKRKLLMCCGQLRSIDCPSIFSVHSIRNFFNIRSSAVETEKVDTTNYGSTDLSDANIRVREKII